MSVSTRRGLAMALAGGAVACSLALDLGSLDEGCPADTKLCNGTCVSLDSPKTGCGRLNTCAPCALYNAKVGSCRSDTHECIVAQCEDGFDDCEVEPGDTISQGCPTNLNEDPLNCQTCFNVCPPRPHAEPACGGGVCYTLCEFGYGDCRQTDPLDGCETELLSNAEACGSCEYRCVGKNMTGSCVQGACACALGFADCSRLVPTDGCETDLSTVSNCGACGVACADGQTCTDGVCLTP